MILFSKMERRPICPNLVALSKEPNSTMLLGKAEKSIQENYNSMWKSMTQYRLNNHRNEFFPEFPRQTSPIVEQSTMIRRFAPIGAPQNNAVNVNDNHSPKNNIEAIRTEIIHNSNDKYTKNRYSKNLLIYSTFLFISSVSAYLLFYKVFSITVNSDYRKISEIQSQQFITASPRYHKCERIGEKISRQRICL